MVNALIITAAAIFAKKRPSKVLAKPMKNVRIYCFVQSVEQDYHYCEVNVDKSSTRKSPCFRLLCFPSPMKGTLSQFLVIFEFRFRLFEHFVLPQLIQIDDKRKTDHHSNNSYCRQSRFTRNKPHPLPYRVNDVHK